MHIHNNNNSNCDVKTRVQTRKKQLHRKKYQQPRIDPFFPRASRKHGSADILSTSVAPGPGREYISVFGLRHVVTAATENKHSKTLMKLMEVILNIID